MKLTPAELKYFQGVLGNPADARELLDNVPSFKIDGAGNATMHADDVLGFSNYVDESAMLNPGSGSRLPPGFYNGKTSKNALPLAQVKGLLSGGDGKLVPVPRSQGGFVGESPSMQGMLREGAGKASPAPTAKNMNNLYSSIMDKLGAEKVGTLDADLSRSTQNVYKIPAGTQQPEGLSKYLNDWFKQNKDGSWDMRQTNTPTPDPMQGSNPRTKNMSVGEQWLRDNTWKKDHFYGQGAPGGQATSKVKSNIGIGTKSADQIMGAANTPRGLVSSLDAAQGKGPSLGGTVDIDNKAAYKQWFDEMSGLKGQVDNKHLAFLQDSISPENMSYAQHPIPKPLDGLKPSHQPTTARLAKEGFATDIKGMGLPGNRTGLATLLSEADMIDKAGNLGGGMPDRGFLKGGGTRAIKTGLKYGPKNMGLTAARALGTGIRTIGPGMAWALPEMAMNYINPEANKIGQGMLGEWSDTSKWFDGRKGSSEGLIRFAADMGLDTVKTGAGFGKQVYDRIGAERAGTNNKTNIKRGRGLGGRLGSSRRIKGLISGS